MPPDGLPAGSISEILAIGEQVAVDTAETLTMLFWGAAIPLQNNLLGPECKAAPAGWQIFPSRTAIAE